MASRGILQAMSNARAGQRRRLAIVLGITCAVLAIEVAGAIVSDSLVLLADAGHMATDAGGIALSLLAMWFAARPASPRRTFGFQRLEILAAVANALLLCGVGVYVVVEAVRRLADPPEGASGTVLLFGLIALVGSGCSMWLLREAIDVLLEATPKGIDLHDVRRHL